ncbi:hypothetical protein EW146_g9578 [Bondarzewia mesenterica]|uniref:Uncharacterized protein n=1 Tax=Bondarzewia mesenterica TaxID=1095465 RepID=A0A4S4L5K7_9AGAM|nr:hypothetical protein EW146_g9578 [Bondarzewia mesenterica]
MMSSKHLATTGDDKKLKVWDIDGLKLLSERELPKKPTQVRFVNKGQTILVSDKFGDVFSYPLTPDPASAAAAAPEDEAKRDALASHENPSGGHLVLGHTSLLTTFCLSLDEKYIVTADRDEHIRVSWYPQGYCIEGYCLGHKKFVSAIHIPEFAPAYLVSGGGDPALKIWDWMRGKLLCEIPFVDTWKPFIKVRAKKRRWGDEGDEGEVEGGADKPKKLHGRKGRGKNKRKQKDEDNAKEGEEHLEVEETTGEKAGGQEEDVAMDQDQEPAPTTPDISAEVTEPTLVLHKIETAETEGQKLIVFSAIGTTALFWCAFPPLTGHPQPELVPPTVHTHDFGKPVIDFVPVRGRVWVLLDAEWVGENNKVSQAENTSPLVKLIQLVADDAIEIDPSSTPLLDALNKCNIPASPADLSVLDLYGLLTSMPKNVDVAHNPMVLDQLEDPTKKMSAKQMGKAQTRKAIRDNQKTQAAQQQKGGESGERKSKKAKSDE